MKKATKKLSLSVAVTFLAIALTSTIVKAQNARQPLPMRISTSEGFYELTVPDTQTTRSAYGGKLRVYDIHIAKMFEVTYLECQRFGEGGNREWSYYAGNGNIYMGDFFISCSLVRDIVSAYGLGAPQNTPIIYGQEESGPPITRNVAVPTLNLVGGKQDRWINFTKNFKPTFR
ncbi:MAG: hypothetical protein ACXITR_00275 [Cyanobacterium sp.]